MPTVAESSAAGGSILSGPLAAGVDVISQSQAITFTRYVRVVLPIDGFVFWVRAQLLTPSALYGSTVIGQGVLGTSPTSLPASNATITAQGSLHYASQAEQDETESASHNQIVFTSLVPVNDIDASDPNTMWLGTIDEIRFSFSKRGSFYRQSGLYHYSGNAVFSTQETQIVDDIAGLDLVNPVVSNSLPIWLAINPATPPVGLPASQYLPLYPSFLVPENHSPPYGSVHIVPETTRAIQAAPAIDRDGSSWQLVEETVEVTLYGFRNFNAIDWLQYVLSFAIYTDAIGIMNMPVPRDEKLTQVEMMTLAQKKTITFDINYYQARARQIAQQFIASCFVDATAVPAKAA